VTEAKDLGKGKHILYNNDIWRVMRKEVVVVGTHSHSKTKLILRKLFGGGEKAVILAHHDKVEEVDIKRKTGQLISKLDNKVQVMDSFSYETFDADIEPELFNEVNEGDEVIFVDYKGTARVLEKK
jgi:translation elongation factor P/translation initiation factor 5A